MKVLFAVSTENIVDSIIKAYQKKYKEIISSKNVYYYNAIIKELQRNQTYDRIVVSEDLEPFTNNNYDAIDKFIFEKLDSISDEAIDSEGRDIPIIVICSERREKSDDLLVKLFSMGVYDALVGQDRKIEDVCKLLNKPRTKKEAKLYYKIEQGEYEHENENNVSEVEMQNILNHFRRISKNEEKYVESFDRLTEQYNTEQLKIIIKYLPLDVKAVLESKSPKYQEIVTFRVGSAGKGDSAQKTLEKSNIKVEKIIEQGNKKINGPIVIPSTVKKSGVRKISISDVGGSEEILKVKKPSINNEDERNSTRRIIEEEPEIEEPEIEGIDDFEDEDEAVNVNNIVDMEEPDVEEIEENESVETDEEELAQEDDEKEIETEEVVPKKRGRGRPRKVITEPVEEKPKRGRGRPRKNPVLEEKEDILPEFEDEENEEESLPGFGDEKIEEETLPGFDDEENDEEESLPGFDDEEESLPEVDDEEAEEESLPEVDEEETEEESLPEVDEEKNEEESLPEVDEEETEEESLPKVDDEETEEELLPEADDDETEEYENGQALRMNSFRPARNQFVNQSMEVVEEEEGKKVDISRFLSQDKKVVAFVGTSKNGVSFLVNNLAYILSSRGINTALVDVTKNKNSFYIFTENKDELREVAYNSMESLKNGRTEGIQVNRSLTVYTSSPNIRNSNYSIETMLTTLVRNYSVVLLDCDYTTSREYFRAAQEIYLVQSMDVLTIQPLTEFLRKLKLNNILDESKLKAIVNKAQKVKGLNENMIVGGMSTYNDPEMSIQDRLFDMKTIPTTVIPLDTDVYQSYLSQIANCEISTKGYNRQFLNCLNNLADQVYPMVFGGKVKNNKMYNNYNNKYNAMNQYNNYAKKNMKFSNDMNETLNKMKNQYK